MIPTGVKGVTFKTLLVEVTYISKKIHFKPPIVVQILYISRGVHFEPPSVKVVNISIGVNFQPPTVKDHNISIPEKGISFFVNNRSLVFPKDSDHG